MIAIVRDAQKKTIFRKNIFFKSVFSIVAQKIVCVLYKVLPFGDCNRKSPQGKRMPASGVGWPHAEAQASSVTSYCLPALCSPGSSCLRHRAPWNRNARCRFRPPRKSPSACPLSGNFFAPPKAGGTVTIPSLN